MALRCRRAEIRLELYLRRRKTPSDAHRQTDPKGRRPCGPLPRPRRSRNHHGVGTEALQSHRFEGQADFPLPAESAPLMVLFDKGGHVLKSAEFHKEKKEWLYQL